MQKHIMLCFAETNVFFMLKCFVLDQEYPVLKTGWLWARYACSLFSQKEK